MLDENKYYCKLLSVNIGGKYGIITSISNYIYQSLILTKKYPILSAIFDDMACLKIKHLQTIQTLLYKMGQIPTYNIPISNVLNVSDSLVSIELYSLKEIIENNILNEEKQLKEMVNLIKIIDDSIIQAILKNIIADNKTQIKLLNRLLLMI